MDPTETLFQFIKKWKWAIMIFWGIAAISCCFFALDLPNQTVFAFLPPSGSESMTAYNEMQKYFPDYLFTDIEVILIEANWDVTTSNTSILEHPDTQKLVTDINSSIWQANSHHHLLLAIQTYYDSANLTSSNLTNPRTNLTYDLQSLINSAASPKYIASSGSLMLLYVQSNINGATTQILNSWIDAIRAQLTSVNAHYPDFKVVLTGGITIFQEFNKVIASDITSKDMFMMPIIFMIMIYMIGSWKLVALPGANLGMTILISFGIFYPFAVNGVEVNPMAPSIMMFMSMALSIDYSMFLLSRFAGERRAGKSVDDAVRAMLRYSAHVCCLSGVILIICYGAIVIFPVSGMETVGYGAAIAISMCILINVSMTTSAILAFPGYYGELETVPSCLVRGCARAFSHCACCRERCWPYTTYGNKTPIDDETLLAVNDADNHKQSMGGVGVAASNSAGDADALGDVISMASAPPPKSLESESAARRNCYFRLTQYTTRWPYNIIVPLCVYLVMLPGIIELSALEFSIDFTMNFPQHVECVDAYNTMISEFNPGDMAPIYLLVKAKDQSTKSIWTQNYFASLCAVGNALVEGGFENVTTMTSMGFAPSQYGNLSCVSDTANPNVAIKEYELAINNPSLVPPLAPYVDTPYYAAFMRWFGSTVNMPDQTVSVILALPQFNPYTASALENCENYRDAVNSVAARPEISDSVEVFVHNSLFWEIDALHQTEVTLPWSLAIIISITFLIIGTVFRSVFLPLRLFLCIVVPILFVYGVVTGVYQDGWLAWTGWDALQESGGIYWMLPVITCTVLVGLALDYEIFLFSRVFEFRSKGYTTSAAIILGVSTTGPIISAAGCVMALSFSGLLLETIVSSNQMGLVFVFGVLVDTFVVRPLLVPSILSFADRWNWWPTQMPMGYKNEYGERVGDADEIGSINK